MLSIAEIESLVIFIRE